MPEVIFAVLYFVGLGITFIIQQDLVETQARPWLFIDTTIVLLWPVEAVVRIYQFLRKWKRGNK